MTLVLSMAAPGFAVQVSDRRVTVMRHGRMQYQDDDVNKQTIYCNRMAFGYTGLAHIGPRRTDVWLTEVLSRQNTSLSGALQQLAKEATVAVAALTHPDWAKRLAFVGVGWANVTSGLVPIACRVSNFHDKGGRALPVADAQFTLSHQMYDRPPYWAWHETGAAMRPEEIKRLTRALKRCSKRNIAPRNVVRLFAAAIRDVAKRDSSVGRNLLAVLMPRTIIDQRGVSLHSAGGLFVGTGNGRLGGPHMARQQRPTIYSAYMPATSTQFFDCAPNVACGGVAMTAIRMGPLSGRN